MKKQRRQFDTSFKLEVVRMIKEQGLSVPHVSQSMNIGQSAIRRWTTQYESEQSVDQGVIDQGVRLLRSRGLDQGVRLLDR